MLPEAIKSASLERFLVAGNLLEKLPTLEHLLTLKNVLNVLDILMFPV